MATFHFDLVSPEKLAFSGEVDQVDIPGAEGDFGVLAGHAPVVAAVRPGILTVTAGGAKQKIIVLGGLAEVSEKGLTLLADTAVAGTKIDVDTVNGVVYLTGTAGSQAQVDAAKKLAAGIRACPRSTPRS